MDQQRDPHNTNETFHDEASRAHDAPVRIDTEARLGRGPILVVGTVLLLVVVLVFAGIHSRASAENKLRHDTAEAAVDPVFVTSPSGGAKAQEIRLPANTQAFIDTPIFSRTNGYLLKWYADIGTSVRKGQLLAVIQTPEVDQQVAQAKADVATAQSNEQIAEITANRWKTLLAKNAVSKQETDQALSDLTSRQSSLNSAKANLSRLEQLQDFERIYAPFDGVVTARNVDIGSLVQAGDSNTPHSELFHMSAVGTLRLFVPVPEVYAGAVHNGAKVAVTSDAFPNERFEGTVVRNANSIDASSRTLNVEVDLPNSTHKMLPGQYAFVHIPIPSGASSMTLPSNTLLFRAEGLQVAVVQGDRVHLTPVAVGHDYGATVEITAGLQPMDKVVLNPSDSLAEGAHVHVEQGKDQ